jgi:hypothetical protein
MRGSTVALLIGSAMAAAACTDIPMPVETTAEFNRVDAFASGRNTTFSMNPALLADIEARLTEYVTQRGAAFAAARAAAGVDPQSVAVAPLGFAWVGELDGQTVGREVYLSDRGNKQLIVQWVPGDPRRNGRTDIGYAVDALGISGANYVAPGVSAAQSLAAIDRALATWDAVSCASGLTISKGDFFDWLFFDSDVFHEGFFALPVGVLGVTSPFVFVDPITFQPTDIDGDGNLDYAFAVITYNSLYLWGIGANVDVESIALHEMGHGFGQAHFGAAFQTGANGKLHFAPRAVMNAAYSGVQQSLTGTDRGGFCSMYGSWPNN